MMGRFVKAAQAAMQAFRHGGVSAFYGALMRRTRFDYRKEVGDFLDTSVVMAPVQWVQRALPEARLTVRKRTADRKVAELLDHPMLALIQRPNPFYADIVLWWGVVLSLILDGNAYWMIVRNAAGRPVELWYIPHWMLEPKWPDGGTEFISHYRYSPGGGSPAVDVDPMDIVHFRYGINPRNMRKGLAPIDSTIREIFMDIESSNFVAALLRNMGVPGIVISPKGGAMPTPQDVEATKTYIQSQFGGDGRGKPLVLGAPTDVQAFGFNPQQMNMTEARDIAEERVCAAIGIPAAVVGFGAGLQQTQVGATMKSMSKQAWQNGVVPLLLLIADELKRSLLSQFPATDGQEVVFDTSEVLALQEDEAEQTNLWDTRVKGGWAQVYEAREACGLDADDSHRIYLRQISVIEVPADGVRPDPIDAAKAVGSKSGDERRASQAAYRRGAAFALIVQRQERGLQAIFEKPLIAFFGKFGRAASDSALSLLKAELGKARGAKSDELIVDTILDQLGIPRWASELRQLYEAHYLEVAKSLADAAERAGLGASMPDRVAQSIIAAGGRRAGIIDMKGQTRSALFEALAEGRAAGEGAEQLAARIYPQVEGGPWQSAETRARVIARTETKYAQNISTIERAKAGGVQRFIVFDGRLGPGRSLLSHMARDGSIVTAEAAAAIAEAEHPNGTLSFAPSFEEDE